MTYNNIESNIKTWIYQYA